MDFTGSLQAGNEREGAKARNSRMSYEYRAGQVGQVLANGAEVTIGDLAKLLGMSRRQMWSICNRMAKEKLITVRQAPHSNWFKHLISRRK